MKSSLPFKAAVAAILAAWLPAGLLADVKLPAIISDNMVLQANTKDRIWGKADPGEAIEVSFAGQSKKTVADCEGLWNVELEPMKVSSEGATMTVVGKNRINVDNVLVGEVWLGSGQSNMEVGVWEVINHKEEIAKADYPLIRYFKVKMAISSRPQEDCEGKWEICSPKTVGPFSSVMYFFARDLQAACKFPVGLINSSLGSSNIQAWIPKEIIAENPSFVTRKPDVDDDNHIDLKTYQSFREKTMGNASWKDEACKSDTAEWSRPGIDLSSWKEAAMPQTTERFFGENFDGASWFRREVEIPEDWAGRELTASLGPRTSGFRVYFNGEEVLDASPTFDIYYGPSAKIPGKLVKGGRNLIAIRYFDSMGTGGTLANNSVYFRLIGPGDKDLTLAGQWFGKMERRLEPAKIPDYYLPPPHSFPSALYNAMIAPLLGFEFRGMLWYQGESNVGDPAYGKKMEAMIKSWREAFKKPDMPFYFVQLANHMERSPKPVDTALAICRETQREVLALPNTAMVVAIDIGDAKNVHPKNKQEVGRRLSLPARHFCYGETVLEYSGPVLESAKLKGRETVLKFSHANGGLVVKGGELKGFAVSENGKDYVWANARINGESIVLSSSEIANPKFVRYAWDDNPDCSLYNNDGLPASPFNAEAK